MDLEAKWASEVRWFRGRFSLFEFVLVLISAVIELLGKAMSQEFVCYSYPFTYCTWGSTYRPSGYISGAIVTSSGWLL